MNEIPTDAAFERAYRPFRRDHDRHREEFLQALDLGHSMPPTERARRRPAYAHAVLSLAAVVLVAVTLGVLFWPPGASRATAIENARRQMLQVKSLHLQGWLFQTVERDGQLQVERFPHEFYAERPHRFWQNGYGFSFEGNHRLTNVTHSYSASDGRKSIFVSHDQRLAVIQPANRLETQLRTEQMLQAKIFDQLFAGLPEQYRYIEREEYNGVSCDVYEYKHAPQGGFGERCRLWLDVESGLPVRMKGWSHLESHPEEPDFEYHTIRINADRPVDLFTFESPKDYNVQVIEGEAGPITVPDGAAASGNGHSLGSWIAFNVNDRAVLHAWFTDPPTDAKGVQRTPQFSLGRPGEAQPCRHIPLRNDSRWNWSLLLPSDENRRIRPDDQLFVTLLAERAHLTSSPRPLRLPAETLRQVIREAQESTIGAGSGVEPFTLEELILLTDTADGRDGSPGAIEPAQP